MTKIFWDDVSDPANPGWVLRTDDEDVQLDAPKGNWLAAAADAANYLGWDDWSLGFEEHGACPLTRVPGPLTFTKRLQRDGSGLGIHVDRAITDALGVGYRDLVEITIRRVK